jgi:hypothetical protein
MLDREESKWQWAEGNRYAAEAIKTLLALNGGAAVALLAFWKGSDLISAAGALLSFAIGALLASATFSFAYFTRLAYGMGKWEAGVRLHYVVYGTFVLSVAAFLVGLWLAWASIETSCHKVGAPPVSMFD